MENPLITDTVIALNRYLTPFRDQVEELTPAKKNHSQLL
jgi:hypothetical protein